MFNAIFYTQRDGDRIEGKAMQVIAGAVERINDPDRFSVFMLHTALFSNDAVIRIGFANGIENGLFGLHIDFTKKVILAFGGDFHVLKLFYMTTDDVAGLARGIDGNI